jgi:hypothetical protein
MDLSKRLLNMKEGGKSLWRRREKNDFNFCQYTIRHLSIYKDFGLTKKLNPQENYDGDATWEPKGLNSL